MLWEIFIIEAYKENENENVDVDVSIIHNLIKQSVYVCHNQTSSVNKFANKWLNK